MNLRTWRCNYPQRLGGEAKCPDCSLGFWAQGSAWLHFLRATKSPNTVSGYRSSLRRIAAELEALGYKADDALRADTIVYALAEMSADVGPARFNVARMALKGYLEWRNDPNPRRPLDARRVFKEIRKRASEAKPQDFDRTEVWRRLRTIKTRAPATVFPRALRDVAFMALLLGSGMRPGEAAILERGAIDYRRHEVDVPGFKSSAPATVPVHASVLPVIRRWERDKRHTIDSRYNATDHPKTANLLFHGPEGGGIGRIEWGKMVSRYGLDKGWRSGHGLKFTLRRLRPTLGSGLLNTPRGDLGIVQRQLRHKSPETTARYYVKYDLRKLRSVMNAMRL